MSTTLARSPFTTLLLNALAGTGKPVGDALIPDAGWQPDVAVPGGDFVPYTVLSETVASRSWGGFSDPQSDWQLPYVLEAFGGYRDQCEWMADKARTVLHALKGQNLIAGFEQYGVMEVRVDSIGAPTRVSATQPPIWHASDGVTLWITKESTP